MSDATILDCPSCNQKVRVPTNKGDLGLTCPKCRHSWSFSPPERTENCWPIVRVRKDFWGFRRVVRIDPNLISFRSTRSPISDEMLALKGAVQDKSPWVHLRGEAIREIRVKRLGFVTASSWWNRFVVHSGRMRYTFDVPIREVPHVSKALRELAGDRFHERTHRILSGSEIIFIIIFCVIVSLSFIFARPNSNSASSVLGFAALATVFTLGSLAARHQSEFKPDSAPRKKARTAGTARRPFQSRHNRNGPQIARRGLHNLTRLLPFRWGVGLHGASVFFLSLGVLSPRYRALGVRFSALSPHV